MLNAVKAKIDDYFTRCRLAEFDPRASEPLNPLLAEYEALANTDLSTASEQLAALPISKIGAGKPLSLQSGINPAWVDAVAALKEGVIDPLSGSTDMLTAQAWKQIKEKFSAHNT